MAVAPLRVGVVGAELVGAAEPLPEVAGRRVEISGLGERRQRDVQVPAPERQLAAARQAMLAPDGGRIVVRVELPADVECLGSLLELPEVPVSA